MTADYVVIREYDTIRYDTIEEINAIVAKQRLQLSVNKSMFGAVVGLFRREWPLLERDNILYA